MTDDVSDVIMNPVRCHYGEFHGYYAGSDGYIYSALSNWRGLGVRRLTGGVSEYGYLRVYLNVEPNKNRRLPVHVLICSSFHGLKPSASHEVRHLDGNKLNNLPSNLKWGTKSENAYDRSEHGLLSGRHGNNQKLTEVQAIKIKSSNTPNKVLAETYGVTSVTIANIKRGKTWKNLK